MWSRDGRELFYRDGSQTLVAVEVPSGATFQPGRQVKLFSAAPYATHVNQRDYDVTPDGRRFLMLRLSEQASDRLVIVFNWLAELKAKTAK